MNNNNLKKDKNDSEFNEIKLKYENLKKSLEDISHKIINGNISNNNKNHIENNDMNELLNEIKKHKDTIFNLETILSNLNKELYLKEKDNKALLLMKEKLMNDNTEKGILISLKLKEIDDLKKENNNYKKYNNNKNKNSNIQLINNLRGEIIKKDKIIGNLNANIKQNFLILGDDKKSRTINIFNILLVEKIISFSYFNNKKDYHINDNIYIINDLKEKIKKIRKENIDIKNKYNYLLNDNKSLNEIINTNELLKEEQENQINLLHLMLKEINSKDNKVKIRDLNQKKYKIELIEDQEQSTINNIYTKGNHRNCLSEGKNSYSNKIQNLKLTQNEYNSVKNDKNIINKKMKDYNINNKKEEYILEKYDIIDEKNIGDLNWILLRKKNGNNSNYDDYVWAEKKIQ